MDWRLKGRGTIDDPLPIVFLRAALSKHDKISPRIKRFHTPESLWLTSKKRKYNVSSATIITKEGKKLKLNFKDQHGIVYAEGDIKFSNPDRIAKVYTWVLRPYDEFPSKPKIVGSFRDYEKGGWYTNIKVYEFQGIHYAPIECSYSVDSEYYKLAQIDHLHKIYSNEKSFS